MRSMRPGIYSFPRTGTSWLSLHKHLEKVRPMSLERCIEEALLSAEPMRELRSLALRLSSAGQDKTAVVAKFEEARRQLREANRETDEDVVMDVMDCLEGWCSPQTRISLEASEKS